MLNTFLIRGYIQLFNYVVSLLPKFNIINILPLIEGVMVDHYTQKTNITRDEVEGDIVVF